MTGLAANTRERNVMEGLGCPGGGRPFHGEGAQGSPRAKQRRASSSNAQITMYTHTHLSSDMAHPSMSKKRNPRRCAEISQSSSKRLLFSSREHQKWAAVRDPVDGGRRQPEADTVAIDRSSP